MKRFSPKHNASCVAVALAIAGLTAPLMAQAQTRTNQTTGCEANTVNYDPGNGEDIVVPPDSYFGMGDNRDISKDSRYWGFIPRKNVIGRPMFIYWSFITPADQYQMRSVGDRLGFVTHIIIHFFDETRWSRTLRLVR